MHINSVFAEKMKEAAASVLPISGIVALLCFIFVPMDVGLMLSFVLATALLIAGMALFTLGAEMSMTRIGNHIGAKMTRFRRLGLILMLSFVLGIAITVAEPDLQVLAANVPDIDSTVLIITVSVGVGLFLMLCMVRILFSISLRWMLIVLYGIVFLGAALSDPKILGVAFDSGGVTTGPMTVPFIMAMGVGVASIRSDENAKADSFGLVALCSVGPILAVMLLNAIYHSDSASAAAIAVGKPETTVELGFTYLESLPGLLERSGPGAAADFCIFPSVSGVFSEAAPPSVSADCYRYCVYVCRTCAVFNRCERRLFSGRIRARRADWSPGRRPGC